VLCAPLAGSVIMHEQDTDVLSGGTVTGVTY